MSIPSVLKSAVAALALVASGSLFAQGTPINAAAFDALVAQGPVADAATIAASPWASKIKQAGTLRLGGTQTSNLFSLLNEKDGKARGFDAGLAQLDKIVAEMQAAGETNIPGDVAFNLYATYGLPLEITRDVVKELGLTVDEPGFVRARDAHAAASGAGRFGQYETGSISPTGRRRITAHTSYTWLTRTPKPKKILKILWLRGFHFRRAELNSRRVCGIITKKALGYLVPQTDDGVEDRRTT